MVRCYICIKSKMKYYVIMIAIIYRPHKSNLEFVENSLGKFSTETEYSILMREGNINMLKLNILQEAFDNYGCVKIITEPTRIIPTSPTLLYPIFVSNNDICLYSGVS